MKFVGILATMAVGLVMSACQTTVADNDQPVKSVSADSARFGLSACLREEVLGYQVVSARTTGGISARYAANQLLDRCEEQFDQLAEALTSDGMPRSEARQSVDQMRESLFNGIVEQILSGETPLRPGY